MKDKLRQLLGQCTKEQQNFFTKLYPNGIDLMTEYVINIAIKQCERTLVKNIANKDNELLTTQLINQLNPLIAEDNFECVSCKETNKILQSPINTSYCNYCWTKLLA